MSFIRRNLFRVKRAKNSFKIIALYSDPINLVFETRKRTYPVAIFLCQAEDVGLLSRFLRQGQKKTGHTASTATFISFKTKQSSPSAGKIFKFRVIYTSLRVMYTKRLFCIYCLITCGKTDAMRFGSDTLMIILRGPICLTKIS